MSRHRPVRRIVVTVTGLLTLTATGVATGTPAAAAESRSVIVAAPTSAAEPPLTVAVSQVGGDQLDSTRVVTDLPAGVPKPETPKATTWLIADLDARTVLAGHRVHVPLAPASTLKIFTALALAPKLDRADTYVGQDADAAIDGTKVGIVPGSTYTVDDLMHGMLMSSGNDCANALASMVGGTAAAADLINERARELGALNTVARNTSGLDAEGQVSTAYDLALAGSAALADEQLAKIMTTPTYQFPGAGESLGANRSRFETQNRNGLLDDYDGALGVKNGFTIAARGSFVGAATRDDRTYLAVVMRAEGSTSQSAADLLDWAFEHGDQARPVGTLVEPGAGTESTDSTGDSDPADTDTESAAGGNPAPDGVPDPDSAGAPDDAADSGSLQGALQAGRTSATLPTGPLYSPLLWSLATLLVLSAITFMISRRGRRRAPQGRRRRV